MTLDTGALIAADRNEKLVWFSLRRAWNRGIVPVVPAAALAQAWRGKRNARLAQALERCDVEPLDETLARLSGELCAAAGTDDVVDASVIVGAARRSDAIITSDAKDLRRLGRVIGGIRIREISELG